MTTVQMQLAKLLQKVYEHKSPLWNCTCVHSSVPYTMEE